MATKKQPKPMAKKPLVNWFKREKETEFGTRKAGQTTVNTKTKIVKAPDSVASKGFTKTVSKVSRKSPVTKSTSDKRAKIGIGVAAAGGLIGVVGSKINSNIGHKKEEKANKNINNTIDRNWSKENLKRINSMPYEQATQEIKKQDDHLKKMEENKQKNIKRNEKITYGLASALPIGFTAGIAIANKGKQKKTHKEVSKIYNDGSGSKKWKEDGKTKKVKKYKPIR
jgi:hypothetical protein